MEVIPAIDIINGRCVRLYQGDYAQEWVYSEDPVTVARHFELDGALRIHLVDLEGAREGEPQNLPTVARVVRAVEIPVEFGGGIRRIATMAQIKTLGVDRIILGTAAVESPSLVKEACERFGESVVVSVDARDALVAVRGWTKSSAMTVVELIDSMMALGVGRFIYTDISRDGTLTAPNFDAIEMLVKKASVPIIASGGISSIGHLKRLKGLGVEGAIIGRALYTADLELAEAIAAVGEES